MEIAYVRAREWGHSWRDFLDLPIPMWWTELDEKLRIQRMLQEETDKSTTGAGGFTKADWKRARAEHRKKLNGG